MSFVTAIRDYVETLNTLSNSLGENLTLIHFISETSLYILKTIQIVFLYIVSFQWIRDFTLLPIVLPQFSFAIFKESFFLETPSKTFFEFLEIPDFHQNKFLLGFLNSFFLTLPLSVVHILSVRRLFIQGIPSAVYSIGGYLAGQILFLTFTVFGFRQILIPWLTLEPINYLLGMILIFRTIYSMTQENLTELTGWGGLNSQKYRNFFFTSFLLAWCEQTSIFEYLGNLTLSSNVTILESFAGSNSISSFFTHVIYIFGISLGSILFTVLWGFFFLQIKNLCILYTPLFLTGFIQLINKTSFVLALALSLTSIPFYGFDYLVTGPLGFVSQDSVFKNTVLAQNHVKDYEGMALMSGPESQFLYVDVEVSPFDRGEYLTAPKLQMSPSFEELNYRGEHDWIKRQSKVSGITDSKSGFFTLSKVFNTKKKTQDQLSEIQNLDLNPFIPAEISEDFGSNDLDPNSQIKQRFNEFYSSGADDGTEAEMPYKKLYSVSFPADYLRTSFRLESQIEQKIKQKYESNPVYQVLLAGDIDFFLKRQPGNFQLSGEQEFDLYTKRRMLESYSDSLRYYSDLPYSEDFDFFFDGTKSFSSKVYNQQFKGTWRSLRRLFTLTLDSNSKNSDSLKTVLKFDQPLYQFSEKQKFSPYHEELSNQILPYEENLKGQATREQVAAKEMVTSPLYAGWDEQLRKFVITNKFIPRKFAGYQVNINSEMSRNFSPESSKRSQKIEFTTWPLLTDTNRLLPSKNDSPIPYVTLYERVSDELKVDFADPSFNTLPANLEKFQIKKTLSQQGQAQSTVDEGLAPKRGGFIWPGNSTIKWPSFSKS
jgi:hypothetical protein